MGVAPANARLSMVRCLPSDAMTFVRDSAFLCATASSCTRWPVACRHLLIVSEFMLSDCLAEVHESRSWMVLPSMSSSSVSGGSVAGLLRDMRHRDRLRERRCECPRHRRHGERERSRPTLLSQLLVAGLRRCSEKPRIRWVCICDHQAKPAGIDVRTSREGHQIIREGNFREREDGAEIK